MQKHRLPSLFLTSITALHHALWLGQIMPDSNISHSCVWTSSTEGRGICLYCSLNGALSVTLITCSVKWVQLSLPDSMEKMLWYSAKSKQVDSASSGSQDSRLLKQFFLSLSYGHLWCSDTLGLIQHVYHVRPNLGLRHQVGSYHSCHWDLLLRGLRVCYLIFHHDSNTLTAIMHLSLGVQYH